MTPSTDLFILIKSLTQTEKRYFKVFASIHVIGDKNDSIKLFEAIDKQKEYNEKEILSNSSNESFTNHFAVTKNYLYRLILKSLRNYHADTSANIKIKDLTKEIEILYKKGLFKQCDKILRKAKKLAYSYENHVAIIELLEWKYKIMQATYFLNITDKDLNNYVEDQNNLIKKLKNIKDYHNISMQLYIPLIKKGMPRSAKETKQFDTIIKHSLFKNKKNALSFEAKRLLFNSLIFYYYAKDNIKNTNKYVKRIIDHITSHPKQIEEHPEIYISGLNNYIITLDLLKRWRDIPAYINKLKAIPVRSIYHEVNIFTYSFKHELHLNLVTGNFHEGLKILPEIEDKLQRYKSKIDATFETLFYFDIAYLYLGTNQFEKALIWNNKILNKSATDFRQDVQSAARLLNLFIHYELGHDRLIEYFERTTHRFLSKRKQLYKIETILLNFFRKKIHKAITQKEVNKVFTILEKELITLLKDPFEKKALDYFDFISWLESKIQNRPFAEIVREKAKIASNP